MSRTRKSHPRAKAGRAVGPASQRSAPTVITVKSAEEPRLRFDRTAVEFVVRLQQALERLAPKGKTVVVTCTAPIRQDSKTRKILEVEIAQLIATRKSSFESVMFSNRTQVRVLKGGPGGLVGFIHNPRPGAEVIFDLTRALIRSLVSRGTAPRSDRTLVIRNKDGRGPARTLAHLCDVLGVRTKFTHIFVSSADGLSPL